MLRALVLYMLMITPSQAWETKSGRVCELFHTEDGTSVRVTYDPVIERYAIKITAERPWPVGPIFVMRFDGPRGNTISTDRHVISGDGNELTVTDSGFGNVLNGLEFNDTATALIGNHAVTLPLEGAGPAVQEFRNCASGLSV